MNGTMVEFKSNGATCKGYLSVPKSGSGPGVVVLQEWWGLVDHIKDVCDRFAAEGYVALAPDLYRGESTTSPDEAGKLMMALNIDQAEKDMRGAIQHLLSLKETKGKKVGTVGFCMGGQLSFYAACTNPSVGACVIYYGVHPAVKPDIVRLNAPVLGFFASKDSFVTREVADTLEKKLKSAGKQVTFHHYEGANHGFFNDTKEANYHKAFAQDTWNKTLAFYKKNLA
jgi:carboxymethylenebutenolidase